MTLRALRKMLSEIATFGAIGLPLLLLWAWTQNISVATSVLLALGAAAALVTLLSLLALAPLPFQYRRHSKALRDEVSRRGTLSKEATRQALLLHRLEPEAFAYRDPRVIPWWEW